MALTVFQVAADIQNAQILETFSGDGDLRKLFAVPANGESVSGRPWPSHLTEDSGPVPNRSTQPGIDN
jgi:hypothetical protein